MNLDECYGKLFPSILSAVTDKPVRGKVLWFERQRAGGSVVSNRVVGVDQDQWNSCTGCEHFDNCYKLSLAELALEIGVLQN